MRTIVISLLLGCALTATARPRTAAEKKALAAQALHGSGMHTRASDELKELRVMDGCSLVGYEDGAFAVIGNDDAQTAVLGVSTIGTKGSNPAFEWWLQAIDEALQAEAASGHVRKAPGPDVKKYKPAVEPLVSCKWGQGDPYYRLCPSHPQDVYCATGCVATAMAQILYSHRLPVHGFGTRTIYYPYMDTSGEAITANFGETTYDWDNMLDRYEAGQFTQEQATAVATLMLHCAVAANMQFDGYNHGGSAATQANAADGLVNYFGFTNARALKRNEYSDDDWMDMVYGELNQGNAIIYGGQNTGAGSSGGHAFVINGYNEDGLVYVNWGWNGDAEGYYDIEKLNPNSYKFSAYQDMVIGISGQKADLQTLDITMTVAGELPAKLADDALEVCGTLKVSGPINSTDLKAIRALAGRDADGNATEGNLAVLDLSEAEIVAGGEPYLTENGKAYTTTEGELPYKAFYDCRMLTTIKLPKNTRTVGNGALGGCFLLQKVEWPNVANRTFVLEGEVLYNTDKTELLAVVPTAIGAFEIPASVVRLQPLALAGCVGLTQVGVPASVKEIGGEAFRNCSSLTEIRLHGKEQPTLTGYNTFDGVRTSLCRLMVRSGTKAQYTSKAQWRDFGDNITEYGTTLTANSLDMDYGDDIPRLGFKLSGDNVEGDPELTTTATSLSLPGEYPIHISAGTIADPDVEFVDGTLTIYKAILTVTVADATRRPDEVELPYTLEYKGFVNGEDETILQTLPVVTTDAKNGCAEGTYTLKVSGGESDRYEFKYRIGTLTVDANAPSSGIRQVEADGQDTPVYSLDGRRVKTPQRGIYVSKGKKVIITK